VFALAYLLGITLMPRIRDWKQLTFFRPQRSEHYTHIDELFSDSIDWRLIETHLPDMLRVALSIKAGRITPSAILRRLSSYNRHNRLYLRSTHNSSGGCQPPRSAAIFAGKAPCSFR
jgi:TnpA family transposase